MASRVGLVNKNQPEPTKVGLVLDIEINDTDIWLIQVNDKKRVVTKSATEMLTGTGCVLLRFINKSSINVENYQR